MSNGYCAVLGCGNFGRLRVGLCGKHYERYRKHGSVDAYFDNKKSGLPCTIEGCERPIQATGLCAVHYARKFRHGSTDSLIPNYGQGFHIHKQGYRRVYDKEQQRYVMEHVQIAEKALGKRLPPKAVVHHMNEDPADNHTPFNLVICPDQEYHFLLHKRLEEYKRTGIIPISPAEALDAL